MTATAIIGPPSAGYEVVVANLGDVTPLFRDFMVPDLWDAAVERGVDPVGVIAQSLKETGGGTFVGKVKPWFFNTCGLKVRDPEATVALFGSTDQEHPLAHAQFANWFIGARAQVEHLLAYCNVPTEDPVDPRYVWVIGKHNAVTWADLNGKWAFPGVTYGSEIESIIIRLRGQ